MRVKDTAQTLSLLERLGTLSVDLEAESRAGLVRIVVHGTKEEIRELEQKVREFIRGQN